MSVPSLVRSWETWLTLSVARYVLPLQAGARTCTHCSSFPSQWTLAIGDVWFVVGAVLIASSYSLEQLIVGRLVLGFGVGVYNALCARQQAQRLTLFFGIPTGIAAAITPLYSQSA